MSTYTTSSGVNLHVRRANMGALCISSCILSVISADQKELYQAERYMPSIYSMVVLSVHMFVKHRFKSHELCNCVRNFWLPSNTYSPRRCNTVFTGTISSYTIPWKKCVCIFFSTTWIYNDMSQEIK